MFALPMVYGRGLLDPHLLDRSSHPDGQLSRRVNVQHWLGLDLAIHADRFLLNLARAVGDRVSQPDPRQQLVKFDRSIAPGGKLLHPHTDRLYFLRRLIALKLAAPVFAGTFGRSRGMEISHDAPR